MALVLQAQLVVLACFTASATANCATKTSPLVGASGALSTKHHQVAGTITVIDDCHFQVSGFTYDGEGPAVYWWGAQDVNSFESSGFKLSSKLSGKASNGETIDVELISPRTFNDFGAISVWCDEFKVAFGSVQLVPTAGNAKTTGSATSSGTAQVPKANSGSAQVSKASSGSKEVPKALGSAGTYDYDYTYYYSLGGTDEYDYYADARRMLHHLLYAIYDPVASLSEVPAVYATVEAHGDVVLRQAPAA